MRTSLVLLLLACQSPIRDRSSAEIHSYPLSETPSLSLDGDERGTEFAFSIASGDLNGDGYDDLVVGAPEWSGDGFDNEGAVFVYLGDPIGYLLLDTLHPTAQADARFGHAVALAGDINGDFYSDFLVGAPLWDGDTDVDEGVVYVYFGGGAGLSTTLGPWVAEPANQAATFGAAVAAAGDVNRDGYADIIVGAPHWAQTDSDNGEIASDLGAVYVYHGSASGLPDEHNWFREEPTEPTQSALFGSSVASAGDLNGDGIGDVVIGGPNWGNGTAAGGTLREGRAYVFLGSAEVGLAADPARNIDPTNRTDSQFGAVVSGAGDVDRDFRADIVVTAPGWDGSEDNEGRAYLYFGSDDALVVESPINIFGWPVEPTNQADAFFGSSVAGVGDSNGDGFADVVVGAPGWDDTDADADTDNEGRAFLYLGSSTGLPAIASVRLDPADQSNSGFGNSIAGGDMDADGFADVVVGAPVFDSRGAAYIFRGRADGISFFESLTLDPSDDPAANFGSSAAAAGDVNGDGFGDVVVGAPQAVSDSGTIEGRAYVFLGSSDGLATEAAFTFDPTDQGGALFGSAVAGAGDTNGDGFADVLVGAPGWDGEASDEGRAYLYLGAESGAPTLGWTIDPTDQAGASFGASLSSAGDTNGDGFADVVVGAPGAGDAFVAEGNAYLFLGSATGLGGTQWVEGPTDEVDAGFGFSVSGVGDVNGDGFGDVVVGAPYWSDITGMTAAFQGSAYVYLGSLDGLGPDYAWVDSGAGVFGAYFGFSVAGAGDLNGDGFGDVLVGAPGWNEAGMSEGRVYIYHGSVWGLSDFPGDVTDPADQNDARFGATVAGVGDINGDGLDDAMAGAPTFDSEFVDEGRAYLALGVAGSAEVEGIWQRDPSDQIAAAYGSTVAAAGDVNGDGFADVLVGASGWDGDAIDEGRAYVYYGGDRWPGAQRELGQFQGDGTRIAVGGRVSESVVTLKGRVTQEGPVGGRLWLRVAVARVGAAYLPEDDLNSGLVNEGDMAPALAMLEPGSYRWRARVEYPVGTGHGRWVAFGGNSEAEADFRVLATLGRSCAIGAQCASGICENGICCSAACGVCRDCNPVGDCVAAADDDACGTIDCDEMDNDCRDYTDLISARCVSGGGACKVANGPDCTYVPLNGNSCDGGMLCVDGICLDGDCVTSLRICDDKNECTDDSCGEETGDCEYVPNEICGEGESESESESESEAEAESEAESESESESEAESELGAMGAPGTTSFLACQCDVSRERRTRSPPWHLLALALGLVALIRRYA